VNLEVLVCGLFVFRKPLGNYSSFFGINVKKDLEAAKNEIKSSIAEIKNQINYQPTINFNPTPANRGEYEKKIKEEIKEDFKQISSAEQKKEISMTSSAEEKGASIQKSKERFEKLLNIEKLTNELFSAKFGENYKAQIKFEDEITRYKIIADGAVIKNGVAEEIIDFTRKLSQNSITKPLISQLVRSGTSIGANYSEADEANSKKDFINKIAIAKKETKETKYWLRIIGHTFPEFKDGIKILWQEAQELNLIFAAIIRNSQKKV